jgi:hypothetical protein
MPNYNFSYYYFKRNITIKTNGEASPGYYYIGLRLDTLHMNTKEVRNALGFSQRDEIVQADRGVTVDIEKTFHCAASKGLVGHLSFMIEPQNPTKTDPKWGHLYDTSVCFVRTQNIDSIKSFLYAHPWSPPTGGDPYRTVQGSIKERRRRGQ